MNTDHLKVDKDLFKKKNIGWQRVVARYSIFSIQFISCMRGQSIGYQNILTVQKNSKHDDSIMLLMTSLNEVCFTMPQ